MHKSARKYTIVTLQSHNETFFYSTAISPCHIRNRLYKHGLEKDPSFLEGAVDNIVRNIPKTR